MQSGFAKAEPLWYFKYLGFNYEKEL